MSPTRREFASILGAGALGTVGRPVAARRQRELWIASSKRFHNHSPFGTTMPSKDAFLRHIYDPGIVFHPETGVPIPWALAEWDADDEQRRATAIVRRGMTFSDGTPLTAADVAFTVEYATEYGGSFLSPGLSDSRLDSLERVRATDERTVEFAFSEPVGPWRNLLATPIIPEHVWRDASDRDRNLPGYDQLVGSGPYVVESSGGTSRSTLVLREDVADHPLVASEPAVERVEFRWTDTVEEAVQAVADGRADLVFERVDDVDLRDRTGVDVASTPDGGWDGVVFNLRRTPLDDPAFRATLARCFDDGNFEALAVDGPEAVGGDLPVAGCYEFYRPSVPDAGERYAFFGTSREPVDAAAARSFLASHADRTYEYALDEAESDLVDGRELYLDGVPFSRAHTGNDGADGHGPLRFVVRDTAGDYVLAALRKWIEDLRRVGIPAELLAQDYFTWYPGVFKREEFDAVHLAWSFPEPGNGWLHGFFHSSNADPDGSIEDYRFNPSNYAGADDHLGRANATMSPGARRAALRAAMERIYEDCPLVVMGDTRTVRAVAADWTAGVGAPVGFVNRFALLGRDNVPTPPTARGSATPEEPLVGQDVTLDAAGSTDSDGDVQTIRWDAGADGSVDGTGSTATHAFTEAGTRRVLLQVHDDDGIPDETAIEVAVQPNEPPDLVTEVRPPDPTPGTTVTLDASASSDPDTEIETIEWDVGDDGTVDARGETAEVTVEEAGAVAIRLRVVDEYGVEATTEVSIEVEGTDAPESGSGGSDASGSRATGSPTGPGSASGTGAPGFGLGAALLAAAGAAATLARRVGEDAHATTGRDR